MAIILLMYYHWMFLEILWGKHSYPHFTEGERWGSERVATCLTSCIPVFRRKVAPGYSWSRTLHSLGPGGTPKLYLWDSWGTEPRSGRAVTWTRILLSPHTPGQSSAHHRDSPSSVPNNWRWNLLSSPGASVSIKVINVALLKSRFCSNCQAQADPPPP